ncbi:filament-like plant protein 1 isoform X2 [Prosopis cineraria]|uniref:filament-like plant protein 1 isoform X2 n=1 Tax=Prosopis cineraria TaxID=364024 RepID=UPI00241094A6|nr:filament-like plant protein 1 isoform X2 [Prosopis cineraria]
MGFPVDVPTRQEDLSRRKTLKAKSGLNVAQGYFAPPLYECNLREVTIIGFSELTSLFTLSTASSMKLLKELVVGECDALEQIVNEEGHCGHDNTTMTISSLFPNLHRVRVHLCGHLKSLFSISTSYKLPKLQVLDVQDCPQIGQLFECQQQADASQSESTMKNVLPKLIVIRLKNLPILHTIYHGFDFQTLKVRIVKQCPNIVSSIPSFACFDESFGLRRLLRRDWLYLDDYHYARRIIYRWAFEESVLNAFSTIPIRNKSSPNPANSKQASRGIVLEKDSAIYKKNSSSPKLTEIEEGGSKEVVENDSRNLGNSEESSKEIAEKDSTTHKRSSNLPNMAGDEKASTNEIDEGQLSSSLTGAPPSSNLDVISEETIELTAQEGSKLDGAINEEASIEQNSHTMMAKNAKATVGEGLSSETHDKNKEKVEASVHGSPKSKQAVISNEVKDSELRIMPAPFASPLQEYAQELCGKESKAGQQEPGESRSSNDAPQRVEEPINQCSSKETSTSSPMKPQIATSAIQVDLVGSKSDLFHISAIIESAQGKIMNQPETSTEEEIMLDQGSSQQFAEDDLMRLFQIMEEGHMRHVSKISVPEEAGEATKALFDLEATLKMSLNEIASSEESRLRLQNALSILSSHCSEDGPPSHGLQATIHSLQQEIQTVLSSFNQGHATIVTFNKLEQKEKLINEERSQRKEVAIALLSEIHSTESFLAEAHLKEEELKEKISKLQDELYSKLKEIEECEINLSSLKEQKKKSVSNTIGFIKEFEEVKKERSHMVEDHMKAKQELQNIHVKWSSCLSNLKKNALLLGVHLQQKV